MNRKIKLTVPVSDFILIEIVIFGPSLVLASDNNKSRMKKKPT